MLALFEPVPVRTTVIRAAFSALLTRGAICLEAKSTSHTFNDKRGG